MTLVVDNEETDNSTVETANKDLYFAWECSPQGHESISYFYCIGKGVFEGKQTVISVLE